MTADFEDLVPNDTEAEAHVIGACLLSGAAIAECVKTLDPKHFLFKPHGWMFAAIGALHAAQQPVNAQTVIRRLGETKVTPQSVRTCMQEMDGPEMVTHTLEGVLPDDVAFWADRVLRKFKERQLLAFAEKARKAALSSPEDVDKVMNKLEEQLAAVMDTDEHRAVYGMEDDSDGLDARIQQYIDNPDAITGLPTGWGVMDRMLDGLQAGSVTIVYAPTSRFKSQFVQNIGWLLGRQGIPGLWFTTEMPRVQVRERIVQLDSALNFRWLRRDRTIGKHLSEIKRTKEIIKGYPIYISDRSELEIGAIRADVAQQKKWNNIQYVIVDLLDMVSSSQFKEDSISQQSLIMRQFKSMAKQNDVHVILVTHVSKGDRQLRQKADLDVEDMKGSSSKYQDVDTAISLMPVTWDGEKQDWAALSRNGITHKVENGGIVTVLVAITKNRHGEIGRIPFTIDLNRGGRMWPEVMQPRQTQLEDNPS